MKIKRGAGRGLWLVYGRGLVAAWPRRKRRLYRSKRAGGRPARDTHATDDPAMRYRICTGNAGCGYLLRLNPLPIPRVGPRGRYATASCSYLFRMNKGPPPRRPPRLPHTPLRCYPYLALVCSCYLCLFPEEGDKKQDRKATRS